MGEPAAFFTVDEISLSCKLLDFAIVAKTPLGRPAYQDIRLHLSQRFQLKQDFVLSALDGRHLMLRFQNREDFLQVLLKESLFIKGKPFWFSKWTINFKPDEDSPLVPVWLELPGLPANFYSNGMIQSIAGSIGHVLQVDRNTLCLTRTDVARVCVQLDVSKQPPPRVWVGAGTGGNWQTVVYPSLPLFCLSCKRLGHPPSKCKKKPAAPDGPPDVAAPSSSSAGDPPLFCFSCKSAGHLESQCKKKGPAHSTTPATPEIPAQDHGPLNAAPVPPLQQVSKAAKKAWRPSKAPISTSALDRAPSHMVPSVSQQGPAAAVPFNVGFLADPIYDQPAMPRMAANQVDVDVNGPPNHEGLMSTQVGLKTSQVSTVPIDLQLPTAASDATGVGPPPAHFQHALSKPSHPQLAVDDSGPSSHGALVSALAGSRADQASSVAKELLLAPTVPVALGVNPSAAHVLALVAGSQSQGPQSSAAVINQVHHDSTVNSLSDGLR